jgi:hypothetical protein
MKECVMPLDSVSLGNGGDKLNVWKGDASS